MSDPEVVTDDVDIDSEEQEEGRSRRWSSLLVVILLLLLLLCCLATSAQIWITGGSQQARFIARNLECLQCHTELIPEFNNVTVHNPFALKECTACHTRHGKKVSVTVTSSALETWRRYTTMLEWLPLKWWITLSQGAAGRISSEGGGIVPGESKSVEVKGADSELVMAEQDLCWLCHGSMGAKLGDEYRHQPFVTGRCTNCHNPHASPYVALINQPPNRICLTCHAMGAELSRDQAHSPAEGGWCLDCHDPHASNFKGMIVAGQRDLCFRCHPTVAVLDSMAVQHAPFLNDDCTGCHEPHGSDYRPLLDAEQPRLCYKCHPSISDQFAQESHHPVGVTLTCASCHDPHAAQYPGLLSARDNDFCDQCHSQITVSYEDSLHDRVLCISCHTPHGSPYAPILVEENPDVCLRCHNPEHYDDDRPGIVRNNHPVRPIFYDVNNRKNLTCTSSCHNPHGTELGAMLRYFPRGWDGNCLMCHAVTEGNRVGIDF
ncbi:MAG: cytochrome c3 family protein [Coriobacteriia bacterium]|nr:cytochrome c3 family protein [Coriobacteriia bacterium]